MENLPSPDVIGEWIKAGPWVVAIGLFLLMMRPSLMAMMFPPREPPENVTAEAVRAGVEAATEVSDKIERLEQAVRELVGVQRRILEETLRDHNRRG